MKLCNCCGKELKTQEKEEGLCLKCKKFLIKEDRIEFFQFLSNKKINIKN